MPGRVIPLLICCFSVLTVVSAGRADVMQFTPDRDTTLYEDSELELSNGSGSYTFMGRVGPDGDSTVRRTLLRFDVSAIPADAIIDSVEVSFEVNRVPFQPPNGGTATLHRVIHDWGEAGSNAPGPEGQGTVPEAMDASWEFRKYDTEMWDSPGGDFFLDESASAGYGADIETINFTSTPALLRDVRKWITDPGQNFGWIFIGDEGLDFTARRFDSRERQSGSPALLTVEYHIEGPTDDLFLEPVATGLDQPVVITNAGDDSNRLFIVEREGTIRIVDLASDTLLPTAFLDISDRVESDGSEEGLLGLAFHPEYESNGYFYVNYTSPPEPGADVTRIARFEVSAGNSNVADSNSEVVILEYAQDFNNHNGGDMHFDPDGYLVIASGDGGDGNDPNNRGQSLDTLLGKMLRIDVDSPPAAQEGAELCGLVQNYAIPPDNPFVGAGGSCDEILHYGMRNPWRFSHDARTGEMFIGDVGQGLWEEISYAAPGDSGLNYGWKICEGEHVRGSSTELCEFGTLPIIEYSSSGTGNCSVTGGYVYRGGIRTLQGRYVYGDYCSARIWIATREGDNWVSEEWTESPALGSISTFGQDEGCELYVADFDFGTSTTVYRISNSEILDSSGFEQLRCQ